MAIPKPILDPVFTDTTNEYGPVGSDTGADILAHYRKWRAENNRPGQFLPQILQRWEIGDYDWDDSDMEIIVSEMRRSKQALFERLTRDDLIIALAFAQVIIDGRVLPTILDRTLKAIARQLHDEMIAFRDWQDADYRREILTKARNFLEVYRPKI